VSVRREYAVVEPGTVGELFQVSVPTVNEHLKGIYADGDFRLGELFGNSEWFAGRDRARSPARSNTFGRLLLPHLPKDDAAFVVITDEVDLEYYRLERVFSGAIDLSAGEAPGVRSPTEIGTSQVFDAPVPLSSVISSLNQRHGKQLGEEAVCFSCRSRRRPARTRVSSRQRLRILSTSFRLDCRS
jgi:hypothetical protein